VNILRHSVLLTDILSRTVSESSQISVQIFDEKRSLATIHAFDRQTRQKFHSWLYALHGCSAVKTLITALFKQSIVPDYPNLFTGLPYSDHDHSSSQDN